MPPIPGNGSSKREVSASQGCLSARRLCTLFCARCTPLKLADLWQQKGRQACCRRRYKGRCECLRSCLESLVRSVGSSHIRTFKTSIALSQSLARWEDLVICYSVCLFFLVIFLSLSLQGIYIASKHCKARTEIMKSSILATIFLTITTTTLASPIGTAEKMRAEGRSEVRLLHLASILCISFIARLPIIFILHQPFIFIHLPSPDEPKANISTRPTSSSRLAPATHRRH